MSEELEVPTEQESELETTLEINPGEEADPGAGTDDGTEEVVNVTLGEPPEAEKEKEEAPAWVKALRKQHRETARELERAKKELETIKASQNPAPKLAEKPTLEGCEYDPQAFEEKLEAWHEQKRKVEAAEAKAKEAQAEEQKAWNDRVETYQAEKASLKLPDYEEAEADLLTLLTPAQSAILIDAAKKPALVVYALGKDMERAKEVAKITNPIRFARAIFDLERDEMKIEKKGKTAPAPERAIKGSGGGANTSNETLDKLREEARKTGDFTKLHAYKLKTKTQ